MWMKKYYKQFFSSSISVERQNCYEYTHREAHKMSIDWVDDRLNFDEWTRWKMNETKKCAFVLCILCMAENEQKQHRNHYLAICCSKLCVRERDSSREKAFSSSSDISVDMHLYGFFEIHMCVWLQCWWSWVSTIVPAACVCKRFAFSVWESMRNLSALNVKKMRTKFIERTVLCFSFFRLTPKCGEHTSKYRNISIHSWMHLSIRKLMFARAK